MTGRLELAHNAFLNELSQFPFEIWLHIVVFDDDVFTLYIVDGEISCWTCTIENDFNSVSIDAR